MFMFDNMIKAFNELPGFGDDDGVAEVIGAIKKVIVLSSVNSVVEFEGCSFQLSHADLYYFVIDNKMVEVQLDKKTNKMIGIYGC